MKQLTREQIGAIEKVEMLTAYIKDYFRGLSGFWSPRYNYEEEDKSSYTYEKFLLLERLSGLVHLRVEIDGLPTPGLPAVEGFIRQCGGSPGLRIEFVDF